MVSSEAPGAILFGRQGTASDYSEGKYHVVTSSGTFQVAQEHLSLVRQLVTLQPLPASPTRALDFASLKPCSANSGAASASATPVRPPVPSPPAASLSAWPSLSAGDLRAPVPWGPAAGKMEPMLLPTGLLRLCNAVRIRLCRARLGILTW